MIIDFIFRNDAGDAVTTTELVAQAVQAGDILIISPVATVFHQEDAVRLRALLADAGLPNVVIVATPIRVWKVVPAEDEA